jgi:hypothetical protein
MVDEHWRHLAEAARDEEDPERLLQLIKELNQALERSTGLDPRPGTQDSAS